LAISVATYAAAQFGTGSWIVMLLALVCGTLWTLQRQLTRSLLSPLLAHLIWTPTVILFYPVTSL
jgi:membrane protease YdiL (CAAX protease family)